MAIAYIQLLRKKYLEAILISSFFLFLQIQLLEKYFDVFPEDTLNLFIFYTVVKVIIALV